MIDLSALLTSPPPAAQWVALDSKQRYSWRDFLGTVSALAQTLSNTPVVTTDSRWLLYSENSYQFAVGLMALLHAGKTVLLPINAQPGTLAEWAGVCDGMLGVAGGVAIPLRAEFDQSSERLDSPSQNSPFKPLAFERLNSHNSFIEVVTSGSTGASQVIRKPLSCFEQELRVLNGLWRPQLADSTVFATVSHQHIYGLLFRLLLPLCSGRPFWASNHQYPEQLMADIARQGAPAVLVSSPAHLGRLPPSLDFSAARSYLRLITSSGGPLPREAAVAAHQHLGLWPVEIFGSTETGGVARRQQSEPDQPWQALPGVELSVNPHSGQLTVHSAHCAGGAYLMSDRVRVLQDGRFQVEGRVDRVVKIEQKRLSLTAMEQHLRASPWVSEVRVLVLPGPRDQLVAVIELSGEGRERLREQGKLALNNGFKQLLLAHYERVLLPRRWRYPERMPINSQGKLTLADLEALFQPTPFAPIKFDALEQSAERLVFGAQLAVDNLEFQGHFPELPLLPGVVQVDQAIHRQPWYQHRHFQRVDRLKFKAMIAPGTSLQLTITHRKKGQVGFEYHCGDRSLSSGILVFGDGQ